MYYCSATFCVTLSLFIVITTYFSKKIRNLAKTGLSYSNGKLCYVCNWTSQHWSVLTDHRTTWLCTKQTKWVFSAIVCPVRLPTSFSELYLRTNLRNPTEGSFEISSDFPAYWHYIVLLQFVYGNKISTSFQWIMA